MGYPYSRVLITTPPETIPPADGAAQWGDDLVRIVSSLLPSPDIPVVPGAAGSLEQVVDEQIRSDVERFRARALARQFRPRIRWDGNRFWGLR